LKLPARVRKAKAPSGAKQPSLRVPPLTGLLINFALPNHGWRRGLQIFAPLRGSLILDATKSLLPQPVAPV
jgi:hypothetical protein